MKLTYLSLSLSLMLGACTLAPKYQRPEPPVAQDWPTGSSIATEQLSAEIPWQDFFQDQYLQSLITTALDNNRDLRVALLNIEKAQAQYRIQRSESLPSIDASGSGNRQRNSADLSVTGTSNVTSVYSAGIGFTQFELDLFGRIRSLNESALQNYLATQEARRGTQISLIASVASGYLQWLSDQELLNLAQQTLAAHEKTYELTVLRLKQGIDNRLTLNQVDTLRQTARNDVARFTALVVQDQNALRLLVGTDLPPLPSSYQPTIHLKLIRDIPAGLPSDLLFFRPDILQAEHLLQAANANIGAARAQMFPRISLTANVGSASTELSNLFESGTRTWSFIPSISLPIFHAGAIRAGIAVSEADQKIALARYEQSIQVAFREVADALVNREQLVEQLKARQAFVNAAGKSAELSQLRYKNGIDSFLSVLDAQRNHYSAQQSLISTRLADMNNTITLYKALGGGWVSKTQTAADSN